MTPRLKVFVTLILMLLALIGNVVNVPLFFGIHFIFGSVAVIAAIKIVGFWPAIAVAFVSGLYTWQLWGHPYALLTFMLEAGVVGLLFRRGVSNLVIADLGFWLLAGPFVISLAYMGLLGMDGPTAATIGLKQALNGVFNALIAGLIIKLLVLFIQNGKVAWLPSRVRLNELVFHMLVGLTMLSGAVPIILNSYTHKVEQEQMLAEQLQTTLVNVVSEFQQQTQQQVPPLVLLNTALQGANISGIGILDKQGSLQTGAGDLVALTSKNVSPVKRVDNLYIWTPDTNGSLVNRWKKGIYQYRLSVNGVPGVAQLVVELPAASLASQLESERNSSFLILIVLVLLSIFISFLLTRLLLRPLLALNSVSRKLPENIEQQLTTKLPDTRLVEYDELSDSVTTMSQSLRDAFSKLESARSNLELEVAERTKELAKTSSMLSNILEASTELAIIATDTQGTIKLFNSGAQRLLGYTAESVVNKHTPALFHDQAEVAERAKQLAEQLSEHVEGFDVFVVKAHYEGSDIHDWHYITRNGERVPVTLVVTPITDESNKTVGYLGVAQDITERKRMEKMKSEFISTVSHELRTPLTSVSGALGLVLSGSLGHLPEQVETLLNTAHRNSERLSHLINDLLDIEKVAAGQLDFDIQTHRVISLIERIIEENKAYGSERKIKLELVKSVSDVLFKVDEQRLKQIMANLLSNAIKFSPENETVTIDVDTDCDNVVISVTDRGNGIPEAFQHKLFNRFSQADSSDTREKGGTGLGLSITKELVEHMGGSIGFKTKEGEGTRFFFKLPLLKEAAQEAEPHSKQKKQQVQFSEITENARKILVIEDDEDVAKLLKLTLETQNYDVHLQHNGHAALKSLESEHFDLITLDLGLPDINGLEIIRRLRDEAGTADIPIVVVSGKIEKDRLELKTLPPNVEWVSKPIKSDQLLKKVHTQIAKLASPRVLHVEDDVDLSSVIRSMIGEHIELDNVSNLGEARRLLKAHHYDVILLDIGLPDGSGWELVPDLKVANPNTAIIVLTGRDVSKQKSDDVEAVLMKTRLSTEALIDLIHARIDTS
ncbi:response regulator [Idiomarina seosinensis]|uniref:histidine kinase n=1 Tax=Idiomarina seosinensis TaxID=281739 RepID=A0A432ZDC0_9GAMM|nr:response regulator [Idiomarina seosinensis]RUO75372.1 histidine kinase [Idiomarina seosinensis]